MLDLHFSAGIGRTGTFIALDALHRQGQKTGRINIVEYVHTMREDRMNMIQNAVWLLSMFLCIIKVLGGKNSSEVIETKDFQINATF